MPITTIGASNATLTVERANRSLLFVGSNWHRQLVSLAITGHACVPEQLVLVGYSRAGVLCATGATFGGTSEAATAELDLNTTELATVFSGVATGLPRSLRFRLWNEETLELLAVGDMPILSTGITYTADTGATPVSPIGDTTIIWGKLALYGGNTYLKNDEDGLWYPFDLRGTGETVHFDVGEGGITIPSE